MPTSIDERIMANVLTTLESLSGYTVRREAQMPQPAAPGEIVIVRGENTPQENPPCGFDLYRMRVGIVAYIAVSEDEGNNISQDDEQLANMAADIRKALRADVHRGGIADNTLFLTPDAFFHAQSPSAVLVTIHVQYRTLYADPYSQGG